MKLPRSCQFLARNCILCRKWLVSDDHMTMPPIHHVSIGFLPEGVHPLHRFLSLSNRPECSTSKLDRVLKASAILRHSIPSHDCQFRIINLSEVMKRS
jgi:hypothetical protein